MFSRDQSGNVFVEALIALPMLTLLTFGILEFGNMMWQRQQLQIGVRDAARYWSRCRGTSASFTPTCNISIARNLAFFGNPAGTGPARVPGWSQSAQLTITPDQASLPQNPTAADTIQVTGRVNYQGSPFYNAILSGSSEISYSYEARFIGW